MSTSFTRIIMSSSIAASLLGGIVTASAGPIPVSTIEQIAGAAPVEQVWYRGGYGWGWGGGGALAAGLIAGGIIGAAASAPYYGYGYGYPSYGYYPAYGYRSYSYYPVSYGYRPYAYYPRRYVYRRAYYARPSYGWGYQRAYYRPYARPY